MSTPLSPTRLFVCDSCGATLPVGLEHAGRKCRCSKVLTVPSEDAKQKTELAAPERVVFFCQDCDTRLVARARDRDRKAKCPNCGTGTVVPAAPPTSSPQIPHQCMASNMARGMWLKRHRPPSWLHDNPVYCRVCDTLMRAQKKQVGQKLTCPDCGAKTVVKPPPPEKKPKSALVPEGEEYQLDETHHPPQRPVPMVLQKL